MSFAEPPMPRICQSGSPVWAMKPRSRDGEPDAVAEALAGQFLDAGDMAGAPGQAQLDDRRALVVSRMSVFSGP